jgi:hypothetical protein
MKSPILGSSYVARSVNAADNRMVNLFPEIVPEGGKDPAFLQRAPGMSAGITLGGTGSVRGAHVYVFNQIEYLVVCRGQAIWTSANGAAFVNRGNITAAADTTPVSFAHNDTQVFIGDKFRNTGWVLDMATFGLTQEAGSTFGPDNIGVGTVAYLDGYFVFNTPGSNRLYVSNLLDGTTINPLAWANADGSPDLVQTIAVINGELWIFGTNSIEVWYNAGTTPFPFAPIQGSFNETGCAAIDSVATLDNSLFWLGKDNRGQGVVYRSNGYRADRVSTHAVERQIQRYSDLSDAIAFTYQQDGHAFYVITFPTGNATWVYDVSTQAWHERGAWDGVNFNRHIANCQAFYQDETYVGCTDGKVNILSTDVYTEPDVECKWLRSWRALPPGQNNLKRTAHHSLQIDCETGNDATGERLVSLRWSDDGGHTYNTERTASLGAFGDYSKRVIFRRLGMTTQLRDRVYELSGIDSPIFIMGAELMLSPTDA